MANVWAVVAIVASSIRPRMLMWDRLVWQKRWFRQFIEIDNESVGSIHAYLRHAHIDDQPNRHFTQINLKLVFRGGWIETKSHIVWVIVYEICMPMAWWHSHKRRWWGTCAHLERSGQISTHSDIESAIKQKPSIPSLISYRYPPTHAQS